MATIKHRLHRLEVTAPPRTPKAAWTPPATGEEARREIDALLATLQARQAELDAALASGDPKRVAWAKRTIAENEARAATPEAQERMAEIQAMLFSIQARRGGTVPWPFRPQLVPTPASPINGTPR
jgi:hypothetical protein